MVKDIRVYNIYAFYIDRRFVQHSKLTALNKVRETYKNTDQWNQIRKEDCLVIDDH